MLLEYNGEPCGLSGFRANCGDSMHSHHLISKQMTRGAQRCSEYVEANPHIFREWVCDVHNAELKLADLPEGRAILFWAKVKRYTEPVVSAHLEELRSRSKLPHNDWRLEVILSYIPNPDYREVAPSALQAVHISYNPMMHMTRIETADTHPEHGKIPPLLVTDESLQTLQLAQLKHSPIEFLWKRHVWDHHGESQEYRVDVGYDSSVIFVAQETPAKPVRGRASLVELPE